MRKNSLFIAGVSVLLGRTNRLIHGLYTLLMTGITIHAVTRLTDLRQGLPPVYATAVLTALFGGLCLFLVLSSSLTGRSVSAVPARDMGLQFAGAALTASTALPFLCLACKVQAVPCQTAASAAVYLGLLFFGYGLFLETLTLLLPRSFFFNRTVTVILILAHLLITPRFFPGINPVIILLDREKSPLPGGTEFFQALAFPAVLVVMYLAAFTAVLLAKRGKNP